MVLVDILMYYHKQAVDELNLFLTVLTVSALASADRG